RCSQHAQYFSDLVEQWQNRKNALFDYPDQSRRRYNGSARRDGLPSGHQRLPGRWPRQRFAGHDLQITRPFGERFQTFKPFNRYAPFSLPSFSSPATAGEESMPSAAMSKGGGGWNCLND